MVTNSENNKNVTLDESLILKSLTRQTNKKKVKKTVIPQVICKSIKIISQDRIKIPEIEYFKFPFNPDILNDKSKLFNLIYEEWIVALTDVYKKFISNSQIFYIHFMKSTIIFGNQILCTSEFEENLINEGIKYKKNGTMLLINNSDISILFDFILNFELLQLEKLPFILSKNKFTNSMTYSTKHEETKIVKYKNQIKRYHLVNGFLFAPDFEQFVHHELIFEKI
ncbi:hypothetical protein M153_10386000853 [Pseudoloma neurophilia]|uniref:Uncharacterized protein n=1 Tax=Pseudoloma neurophilia TaxID=146866 RepID=A0A0R0M1F4_9MICR|nr:hypothetical protein M153_10386000853 [Pseudoloma neurophilia]